MNLIIFFSSILTLFYFISFYYFKNALCSSITRLSFLCWNIVFIIILVCLFYIGFKSNKGENGTNDKGENGTNDKEENETNDKGENGTNDKEENETDAGPLICHSKKKTSGFTIFLYIIGVLVVIFLIIYGVKKFC